MNRVPRLMLAVFCTLAAISADGSTWNASSGSWSTASNWADGQVPVGSLETELIFNGSLAGGAAFNDLNFGPFLLNVLTLESSGAAAAAITGNGLRFGGDSARITQNQSGAFNIEMDLLIEAPVILGGDGSGVVSLNRTLSGPAALIKSGTSSYLLGSFAGSPSQNTFHGGVIIEQGTLGFQNAALNGRTALRANRISLESAGASLQSPSELRSGELAGSAGSVAVTGQNIVLYPYGDAEFDGSLSTLPSFAGGVSGALTIRGSATQTLGGQIAVDQAITIAHGAGLELSGKATFQEQPNTAIRLNGGALILNNLAENNNNRLGDAQSASQAVESLGGGTLSLIGNAAGTQETIGLLELGSRTEARSGAITVNVTHTAGTAAATVLELLNLSRFGADSPRTTIDFTAQDQAGKVLALGRRGNNPRILISRPPVLSDELLAPNDTGEPDPINPAEPNGFKDYVGWATVNGSSFATYGPNGIEPVQLHTFTGKSHGSRNAFLAWDDFIVSDEAVSLNSLKIAPSRAGRLTIAAKGNLRTNAILLAGNKDYSIVNLKGAGTFGGLIGRGGSRYIYVQSAVLTIGVDLNPLENGSDSTVVKSGDSVTKSGAGTLVLTSEKNQALLKSLTINEGTVRAAQGSSLPGGEVALRGGVLEISGGSYEGKLGNDPGEINWRANQKIDATTTNKGQSPTDKGSGGFSAFGNDAAVKITVAANHVLAWEEPYFVESNDALIFGSTRADHCVTFLNDLALLDPSAKTKNFNAREIRVIDNPESTADFARLAGRIEGSVYVDLLKTGGGALELTGQNGAFQGGIVVAEGSLLSNNDSGFGASSDAYILLGKRSGSSSSALLTSNHAGTVTIARNISVQSGSTGEAVIGNTSVVTAAEPAASAGNAIFSGRISLGLTGCGDDRKVRLHAEPNTSVTFSGGIASVGGYLGTMDLELSGEGAVLFSGASSYLGKTQVSHGSLKMLSADALSPWSRIALAPGTSLALNGFNQTAGSLEGMGSVDLGGGILFTGGDDSNSLYGGTISGAGGLSKIGAGRLILTGANSYAGETNIAGGILAVDNVAGSATGSGPVIVLEGAALEGTGAIIGTLEIRSGGALSPGEGVGKLTTGPAVYGAGGIYRWEMQDATANAGVDCHRIQGALALAATAANPFVIEVNGLARGGDLGKVDHFSSTLDYAWLLASTTGGITGFDPAAFQVNTAHFAAQNPFGNGSFSVSMRGNDLLLLFTGSPLGGAGVYNGLVTNASPNNANTGYFRISVTKSGSFSGLLQFGGLSYALRGKFDAAGNFAASLKGPGGAVLPVTLHLADNEISGSVGASAIAASRSSYRSAPGFKSGSYTLLLPPETANAGAEFPQGYGYAVMKVGTAGTVALKGKLGDGTPFSMGSLLDNDGIFPFYAALYASGSLPKGSIQGLVKFEEVAGVSDFDGLLNWEKPPRPADRFYAAGFKSSTHLIGSKYAPPQPGLRALNLPDGNAQFSLPDQPPIHILISPRNTVAVTDTLNSHSLKLILNAKTGLFSGSFQLDAQPRTLFQGVLFQKQRLGAGLFLGFTQSSAVRFGSP